MQQRVPGSGCPAREGYHRNLAILGCSEQCATAVATRIMYAAPNRRTSHRLARLDLPTPSIFRAPGETPGMYALDLAMDEMAIACGLDPVEFRIRNEPAIDPDTKHPFSSRGLVACLREGARRFDPRFGHYANHDFAEYHIATNAPRGSVRSA